MLYRLIDKFFMLLLTKCLDVVLDTCSASVYVRMHACISACLLN
jgi:hypothetical protein